NDRQREISEKVERASRPNARAPRRDLEREIVIRRSAPGDGPAMSALAALDGQQWSASPALVAEVDGSLRAVMPLDGGEPFADPFHRTCEILALLELRAKQLKGGAGRRRFLPRMGVAQ